MALPKAYLTSVRNLPAILNAVQGAKAPPQFNQRFLRSLKFESPSDRNIIGVLKALKFISDDGVPTEKYYAFLDQAQAPGILADGIRGAYPDLFRVSIDAQNLTKNELISKFRALSLDQLSGSVADKMTMTFKELCKLADFQTPAPEKEETKRDSERTPDEKQSDGPWGEVRVDGRVYRVQTISRESRDRWRALITRLVVFLIAILAASALVGTIGTLLRE